MRFFLMFFLIISSVSCKENGGDQGENESQGDKLQTEANEIKAGELQNYTSREWGVSFDHPDYFQVYEGELAPNSPVVNIFPVNEGVSPPLGIHEEARHTYIAIIPHGYGVDGPAGKMKSIKDWDGGLPINFNIDRESSTVYLLENEEPWGFLINFQQPPEKWQEYGSIFVRLGVRDFKAVCEDKEQSNEIPMASCDPMAGDVVKYYGEVMQEERQAVYAILRSLQFFTDSKNLEPLEDLIQVEFPGYNAQITSPVKIGGQAKGYWFFEAVAPVELVDEDHRLLGEGTVTAQGEWMTEDFVPFEGSLEFEKPSKEKGCLIFKRANASGKPEHDRALYIPVKF
ncbi:hypothetical protein FHG64_04865 [Antarcticibacterium flavum]|uniref:Bacterial spore germination immunoglobulin-like domain-containing protein n=1 Tax=Antarcticibacterium flavum TaxID=2058175 RepID=A0A5B7X0L5_9FLAO|nr:MULTISPECIES: Gmad2 immunoglobulin-like domain-containing protein [Antarcticibacterium]MCM4160743.1 hypothetical protein [Antarcticibacterium sp. W02-3]QCY68780.1 hypothetical protein FHG64_04865 [Antarcticibacterium flavum]